MPRKSKNKFEKIDFRPKSNFSSKRYEESKNQKRIWKSEPKKKSVRDPSFDTFFVPTDPTYCPRKSPNLVSRDNVRFLINDLSRSNKV